MADAKIDTWAESQKQADEADKKYGKGKWHWADYCGGYCRKGNHIHAAGCCCQECEEA